MKKTERFARPPVDFPFTDEAPFTILVAAEGFVEDLLEELGGSAVQVRGRLVLASGDIRQAAWAQNIWFAPRCIPVTSISDAARRLRAVQRNWHLHPCGHYRRAALIQEQLPPVSGHPLRFGDPLPTAPLGSWTLWEPNLLLASSHCSSPFADGVVRFYEDRQGPPSRAYLKLWELFTLLGKHPEPGEVCVDAGAAPGGWTWVLAQLGARVFSLDKAPLAPSVASLPNVESCLGSGFGLDPREIGPVDWLFSDMICYPDRLFEFVKRWKKTGLCKNFVCTLKCQGKTDHAAIRRFAEFENSVILHLSCNKHELTWACLQPEAVKTGSETNVIACD